MMLLINKLSLQLNLQSHNELFDTSDIVVYTFKLTSNYRLSVASTIQCLASIFVLNSFNLLTSIGVMSVHKSLYILTTCQKKRNPMVWLKQ